ncbi:MAG: TolC family protein [Chthoniobacterales bacterium]
MLHLKILLALCVSGLASALYAGDSSVVAETTGPLTLRRAVALALVHHPDLAVFAQEIRIAEARRIQARLPVNPAVHVRIEDVTGSGAFRSGDRTESTLELAQVLELGGKRPKRTRAALHGRELAEWDYAAKRLEVATKTTQAFVALLGTQRRLLLARETFTLAEKFAPLAQERVDAGRASPLEVSRASLARASARIVVEQEKGQLAVARKRLSAQWSSTSPRFSDAVGDLEFLHDELPGLSAATGELRNNPRLARSETEDAQRAAQLASERAKAWPDLTLNGGVRRREETGDATAVLGFSLPLPLLNRNQGGIAEARAALEKTRDEQRAAAVHLNTALAIAYEELEDAEIQIKEYRASVLPQIDESYRLSNEGYEAGRFSYLEVLDARRSAAEARAQYLDALVRYHSAAAEIEGLTARTLTPSLTP